MRLRVLITLVVVFVTLVVANACGGKPSTCSGLCGEYDSSTDQEKSCVAAYVAQRQPAVLINATRAGINSASSCSDCYAQVGVSDSLCADAADSCL